MKKKIIVFNNSDEINDYLLSQWIKLSEKYIAAKGFFSAALSGGNSPKAFYNILFNSEKIKQWDKIFIFLVDERFVNIDHPDSNSGMIKNLINNDSINFYPINTDQNIIKAAKDYENFIKYFFKTKKSEKCSFDFILLGIGRDGHTASLFPDTKSLYIKHKLIVNTEKKGIKHPRISMTFKLLDNTKNVFFLVTGDDKALIIKEIIKENKIYPANNIHSASGKIIYLLDKNSSKFL
ncbi:MAG: 6-phosphogluconolactonase [Spirochaetes bacterium]|nr:6-phosphogluconolactonase [Spirochaetota bacterium]